MSSPAPTPEPSIGTLTFGGYIAEPEALEGVGFWPRAAARLIDFVFHYALGYCSGLLFALLYLVAATAAGHRGPLRLGAGGRVELFIAALLGSVAYEVICEGLHGSTLGKLALSIVVVQEDGTPCRFASAVIRALAYFLDSLFFGLIGYSAMQRTPKEQRYGDQWAETIVCKRSRVKPENLRGPGRFVMALLLASMVDVAFMIAGLLARFIS